MDEKSRYPKFTIWYILKRTPTYQKGLQALLSHQEEKVLSQIIHWPGISGLAGVLNKTLIQFDVL